MKNITTILGISLLLFSSCGSSHQEDGDKTDTTLVKENDKAVVKTDPITGKLTLIGEAKLGQPINIKFTVYNTSDTTVKFCKWHTPFERLSAKYLDVAFEDYTDISYLGAMAKRVMPPPADSYTSLNKGDSTSTDFNLAEGYAVNKVGSYTIKYNSATVSGIVVPDSLKINVKN